MPGKIVSSDLLVVGAGIVGLSVAHAALLKGLRVSLVDRADAVSGASAANLGQISLADREASIELPWVYRTLESYRALQRASGRDLAVRQSGGLALLYTRAEMDKAAVIVREKLAAGLQCSLLRGAEVKRQEPHLNASALSGAVYAEAEGVLDPLAINYALLDEVVRLGGRLFTHMPILSFETRAGQPNLAHAGRQSFQADKLVICTGAWSRDVVRLAGLEIPIGYVRASALVTQPLPPLIRGAIAPGGFLTREISGGSIQVFGAVQEQRGGVVFAQANRAVDGYDTGIEADCAMGPTRLFLKHFPSVAPFQVLRSWSAVTSWTPDELPFFGYVPGSDSLFLMCGLKGAYSTAMAAGADAAACLAGETANADFARRFRPFAPERFGKPADTAGAS
jgi:glycine/D-amino acid oxidase-like deaminating enzyme